MREGEGEGGMTERERGRAGERKRGLKLPTVTLCQKCARQMAELLTSNQVLLACMYMYFTTRQRL